MDELATEIAGILHDYHRYNGFDFNKDHVLKWSKQFDDDQEFILEEFLHLLKQGIYISESKGRDLLIESLINLSERYGFKNVDDFLGHVDFLALQKPPKSQTVLLEILDDELNKRFDIQLKNCGAKSKKYAIYFDDILVSGNTIFNDLAGHTDFRSKKYIPGWLEFKNEDGITNAEKVIKKEKIVIVSVFCIHTWNSIEWRLKGKFGDEIRNKIKYDYYYQVQNLRIFNNQRLNFAYPLLNENKDVEKYFNSIDETSFEEVAFRKVGTPAIEKFFSTAENRIRFENILLNKGIELFNKVEKLKPVQRPLGITPPFHKTLGTGTLFFTWRNISNTTPIVFWWDNHGWYYLFELINRGN